MAVSLRNRRLSLFVVPRYDFRHVRIGGAGVRRPEHRHRGAAPRRCGKKLRRGLTGLLRGEGEAHPRRRKRQRRAHHHASRLPTGPEQDDRPRWATSRRPRYKGQSAGVSSMVCSPATVTHRPLLQGASVADYLIWRDDQQLHKYRSGARRLRPGEKKQLEAELAIQAKALSDLERAKKRGSGESTGHGRVAWSPPATTARCRTRNRRPARPPAVGPRRHSRFRTRQRPAGKITPRMYHALTEARLAGFTRYTHCWRTQDNGEHPQGQRPATSRPPRTVFGGVRRGCRQGVRAQDSRAWCMANAEALGVLYVIWFRQIWMPGVGWASVLRQGRSVGPNTPTMLHLSVFVDLARVLGSGP